MHSLSDNIDSIKQLQFQVSEWSLLMPSLNQLKFYGITSAITVFITGSASGSKDSYLRITVAYLSECFLNHHWSGAFIEYQ